MAEEFDTGAARDQLLGADRERERAVEHVLETYVTAQGLAEQYTAAVAEHAAAKTAAARFGFDEATLKKAGVKPLKPIPAAGSSRSGKRNSGAAQGKSSAVRAVPPVETNDNAAQDGDAALSA